MTESKLVIWTKLGHVDHFYLRTTNFVYKKEHFSFKQIIKLLGFKCGSLRVVFLRGYDLQTCRLLLPEYIYIFEQLRYKANHTNPKKYTVVCVVEQLTLICELWLGNL